VLDGIGPQITARSTGTGDAGSIFVSAANLRLFNDASISTEAASANGGNIELSIGNFFYIVDSAISTSVNGSTGNGGNISIDPILLVLSNSDIIAEAVAGHGGNITIVANNFLLSTDSLVSASSQLGISGTIELIGPRVDLNGSLVTLSGDLHGAARVARDNCGAKGGLRSSLVDSGRGGLPQDADATIPALYLAGRGADRPWHAGLSFAPEGFSTPALAATRQIYSASARLDMNCH